MNDYKNLADSIAKNVNASKSNETSLRSLENAINFSPNKNYDQYKKEKVDELEELSLFLIEQEEYEKAIVIVKKLLFFNTKKYEYYAQLGRLYSKLHDISSAVVYYKKAYLLDKNKNLTTYKKLENLLFAKGILSLEEGNLNIDILKEIKTQMDKTHYYYLKAVALLAVGRETEAISKLQKIITTNPNHVEGNLLLGKILLHSDKFREGSQYLWKVNKLQPNHSEIQQYVSIMKIKMKDCLEKANQNILKKKEDMGLLWCSKALSIFPNHPEALILRSDIYKQMGKYKEALEDLNNAYLNMAVDNFTDKVLAQISLTYNELALQLMSSKNYLEAYKVLEEALKFKSDDSFTHMYKGDCLLELKDLNKAKEEYLISYNINPKSVKIKTKIALVNYKFAILSYNNREYKDCLLHIDRAISVYPSSCEFFLLRARSYLKIDQKTKAYEDIKLAYSINPKNKEAIELKKFINE